MGKRCFSLCVTILGLALFVSAQSRVDEPVRYPSEEQRAANQRMIEMLRHPTLLTLRLAAVPFGPSNSEPTDIPPPYKTGDPVNFRLIITHSFPEAPTISIPLDPHYDVRPELFRNGELLSYSKEAQENVDRKENAPANGSAIESRLLPGREYGLTGVSLEDWYKPLGPGHYQLTVRRRFAWDGDWVQSNPVIFDVEARNPAAIPATVTIDMVLDGSQQKLKEKPYRVVGDLRVRIVAINNSTERIRVEVVDTYYGNRPQLFKDGRLLSYREEATKLVRSKEEHPQSVGQTSSLFLDPNTRAALEELNLNNWYGPLGPGLYKLVNRRRFEIDGPWTADSAELFFEVVAGVKP